MFGSRNNDKHLPNSDLDLLIITENKDYFSKGRGAKMIETIKSQYKKTTGVDLDVNVMSQDQYNRAQGGAFKKSVEQNKTEITVN